MSSERYFPQPGVMNAQAHFSRVPRAEIQRSRFDRSSGVKTTWDAGNLIPFFVDEIVPGDTFHLKATAVSRLATPLKPVMDNLYQDMQFFFVPARLCWEHWVNFMGERASPDDDSSDYSVPQANWNPTAALTHPDGDDYAIGDYLGLPKYAGDNNNHQVSALILRAIILCWNEWYRDENLQDPLPFTKADSGDTLSYNTPVKTFPRGKRKDYFTGALPWPQKGDAVLVPLGDQAPLVGTVPVDFNPGGVPGNPYTRGEVIHTSSDDSVIGILQYADPAVGPGSTTDGPLYADTTAGRTRGQAWLEGTFVFPGGNPEVDLDQPGVYADLQLASAMTINALRTAFQLQRMLERDARGGTRYIESIWAHFGVVNPDFRLQRPEFLGSATQRVQLSPVASTYTQSGDAPQGNLSAVGTGLVECKWSHSFTEHGYVIGFMSARADLTYQRGVERFWSRTVREEFYFPALSHLGEQAILNKEIWLAPTAAGTNDDVFGYQERYGEMRYKPSRITGLFSSEETSSLDVWHWSQDFQSLPELNDSFIVERPPIDRTIAVQSEPHFISDIWIQLLCDRPMPVYSVPGLIDHF